MENQTFSIIVPVYDVEQYLENCINSVLNQSFRHFQLILVDDGSKDSSGEICDRFAQKDSRVKVIHKPNAGVSAARNTGIDIATGQFICFIDSDDWIESEYLQKIVDEIYDFDIFVLWFCLALRRWMFTFFKPSKFRSNYSAPL